MRSSGAPSTVVSADEAVVQTETHDEAVTGAVFDIQRFSVHDGPGIRTLVFFKTCLLRCHWCSNPESQSAEPELLYTAARCLRCGRCVSVCPTAALRLTEEGVGIDATMCTVCGECASTCPSRAMRIAGQRMSAQEVLAEVERDRPFYQHSGGGMTLSGGEPLLQPEFALALLWGARARGIHSAVETAGWADPLNVRRVLSETDLILYDVKHMDAQRHVAGTGVPNERILGNARLASQLGVPMIIRTPVIPGFNATVDDIMAIGRFALELGLGEMHLLPFHRYGVPKYASLRRAPELAEVAPPSQEGMAALRRALEALGLTVRIGG